MLLIYKIIYMKFNSVLKESRYMRKRHQRIYLEFAHNKKDGRLYILAKMPRFLDLDETKIFKSATDFVSYLKNSIKENTSGSVKPIDISKLKDEIESYNLKKPKKFQDLVTSDNAPAGGRAKNPSWDAYIEIAYESRGTKGEFFGISNLIDIKSKKEIDSKVKIIGKDEEEFSNQDLWNADLKWSSTRPLSPSSKKDLEDFDKKWGHLSRYVG